MMAAELAHEPRAEQKLKKLLGHKSASKDSYTH